MQNILIIGATSAIAEAAARRGARRGDALYLLARNRERLANIAADLEIRGAASVAHAAFDAAHFDTHARLIDAAFDALGKINVVLIAHGTLPDQRACERDFDAARKELETNAVGVISLLTHVANRLEAQRGGVIAVITSVAGERGRRSNYVYGAAKGMVSIFLQGLRNRLHEAGVKVLDIRPGFVDTPMTADFEKGLLWSQPDTVAAGIIRATDKSGKGGSVVYLPWFWAHIMRIIRNIPEFVFKRLGL